VGIERRTQTQKQKEKKKQKKLKTQGRQKKLADLWAQ
jgi:hypothetical protein